MTYTVYRQKNNFFKACYNARELMFTVQYETQLVKKLTYVLLY